MQARPADLHMLLLLDTQNVERDFLTKVHDCVEKGGKDGSEFDSQTPKTPLVILAKPPDKYLHDGTDFYVIGVIGLQGVGKSTIMSIISGNYSEKSKCLYNKLLF